MLIFLSAVLLSPWVLRGVCALSKRLTRPGAAYISECALPRSASVNSAYTMLVALIAFIWLGSCLIDVVELTGLPSSVRYNADFIAAVDYAYTSPEEELERCLQTDGITGGAVIRITYNVYLAYPDGTFVGDNLVDAAIRINAVEKGADINYCCLEPLADGIAERFDALKAEGGHPAVIARYLADKYGFEVGDEVSVIANSTPGYRPMVNNFTIVGIDDTETSWDYLLFVHADDLVAEDVGALPSVVLLHLDGDPTRFAELREKIDGAHITLYTREGYFPVERAAAGDAGDMLSLFSVIIYIIAAMGLANLVVITAGERRRELDILRLAGMTPQDAAKAVLAETAMLSLSGFAAGLVLAFFATPSPSRRSWTAISSSIPSLSGCSPSRG